MYKAAFTSRCVCTYCSVLPDCNSTVHPLSVGYEFLGSSYCEPCPCLATRSPWCPWLRDPALCRCVFLPRRAAIDWHTAASGRCSTLARRLSTHSLLAGCSSHRYHLSSPAAAAAAAAELQRHYCRVVSTTVDNARVFSFPAGKALCGMFCGC